MPWPVRQRHRDGAGLGDFARQVGPLRGRQMGVAHQRRPARKVCLVALARAMSQAGYGDRAGSRLQDLDVLPKKAPVSQQ